MPERHSHPCLPAGGTGILITQSGNSTKVLTGNTTGNVYLPNRNTTEDGGEVTFSLKLSTEPTTSVHVWIRSTETNPTGGVARMEGIPWTTKSSRYKYLSYPIPVTGRSSYFQKVTNPKGGYVLLNFTTSNWNVSQKVTVLGLDDNYADGNIQYPITLTLVSGDDKYSDTTVTLPLTNVDNDMQSAAVLVERSGSFCSEVYYSTNATMFVSLNTEPLYPVILGFWTNTSSGRADVTPKFLHFDDENYYSNQTVTVYGIDNLVTDGDGVFLVYGTVATSKDYVYATMATFGTYRFKVLDDPGTMDTVHTAKAKLNMAFNMVQGAYSYTTATGGTAWVSITLPVAPVVSLVRAVRGAGSVLHVSCLGHAPSAACASAASAFRPGQTHAHGLVPSVSLLRR